MYDLPTCFQKRKKDGKFMTVRWREPHQISQIPYLLPDRIAIRESTTCQVFATLLCSRRSREQDWIWSLSKLATFKLSHGVIVGLPGIYPPSSQCMSQKQIMFLCQFTFYYSFCFQVFFFFRFQPIILPDDFLRGGEQCITTFTSRITEISWEAEQLSHFRVGFRARYFTLQALS